MADVGAGFTGQTEEEQPIRSILSNTNNSLNRAIFNDPASRSALLQIGLQLMQPTAIGQTTGGAFAQGIGEGGEAVGRIEAADLRERQADDKLMIAEQQLRIREHEAESRRLRAQNDQSSGLTTSIMQKNELEARKEARAEVAERKKLAAAEAKRIFERISDVTSPGLLKQKDKDPEYARFKDMTQPQIEAEIMKEIETKEGPIHVPPFPILKPTVRQPRGAAPTTAPQQVAPRRAPDGNWYVPNPRKPGKFIMVDPPDEAPVEE